MKYQVSPLLLFSAIVLGILIVGIVDPFPAWGTKVIWYLTPVILVSIAIDVLIQKFSKNHFYTCIIEAILILFFIIAASQVLY
jgi:hypothetical protein